MWPYQIPLGSLIPQRARTLIPACKNLGVTHVVNSATRLHPVEWVIGEAAGSLAAFCVERRVEPHAIRTNESKLRELQSLLVHQGVEIEWPQLWTGDHLGSAPLLQRRPRTSARPMTEPLRLGVVGVGAHPLRGILPHLTLEDVRDRVTVQAICDPAEKRVRATAEQYGVQQAYLEIAELLADDEIDAVTIATPIGLHQSTAGPALEAGKHVHVNKTFCTTVAEANAPHRIRPAAGSPHRRLPRRSPPPTTRAGPRAHRRGSNR